MEKNEILCFSQSDVGGLGSVRWQDRKIVRSCPPKEFGIRPRTTPLPISFGFKIAGFAFFERGVVTCPPTELNE